MYVAQTTEESAGDSECGGGGRFPSRGQDEPDLSARSNTSRYQSCFCYRCGSPDSGAKMTCEWDQHIKTDCCFVLFLLAVLSSFCLFPPCVALEVLWNRRWGLSVEKRCNVIGWACFCVWTLFMPEVSIRARWRDSEENAATRSGDFALPYFSMSHEDHMLSVSFFVCVCVMKKKRYFNNNSSLHLAFMVTCRCWVFRLCLFIKVKCWLVFYPRGSRVFVQACACPSDIWLCFNTVHELLFCGTWLAWIHFVYICTLILFTV